MKSKGEACGQQLSSIEAGCAPSEGAGEASHRGWWVLLPFVAAEKVPVAVTSDQEEGEQGMA